MYARNGGNVAHKFAPNVLILFYNKQEVCQEKCQAFCGKNYYKILRIIKEIKIL